MQLGALYIVSAPSGAGKTSLVKALTQSLSNVVVSVSHTTRPQRPKERHGVHYYFVSTHEFLHMLNHHGFLEQAEVFGHYYGTSAEWVRTQRQQGIDVILEIDWQGAEQIKRLLPDALSIFILPPSRSTLEKRLVAREQDARSVVERRMLDAVNEISHYKTYDYLLINDEFQVVLEELKAIVISQRLRREVQEVNHADIIQALLS